MSEVVLEIRLNRTLCSELEDMRDMIRDLDFSGMKASIERVQKHGNAMEDALSRYRDVFEDFDKVFDETKRDSWDGSDKWVLNTAEEKLAKLKEIFDNRKIRPIAEKV